MRENKIKKMMKEGKTVINGWLQIPITVSAEAMAHQGWDSLTIDMQHGLVDYSNALPMLQTISSTNVIPLARVNWNEPGQIMKILDASNIFIIWPGSFQFTLANGITFVDEIVCNIGRALE